MERVVKGHDFSRANARVEIGRALAPELIGDVPLLGHPSALKEQHARGAAAEGLSLSQWISRQIESAQ